MNKDIVTILKEATKDVLTESTLNEIKTAFDKAVNDKVKIHVEKALVDQDIEYTGKLKKVISAIDADHTVKLTRVMETVDKDHTSKLVSIIKRYERQNNRDAKLYKESLTSTLSKYLDVYLEEKVPVASIEAASKNKKAELVLNDIRKMLSVDLAMASESIRDAVLDGKKTIDGLQAVVNEAQTTHKILKERNDKLEAQVLIEQKVAALPDDKRVYMKRMLETKSPVYIKENFDYILNLADKTEEETLEVLKEQAVDTTKSKDATVPTPITESAREPLDPVLNTYMTELNKF